MGWQAWYALGVVAIVFIGLTMDFASDMLLLGGVVLLSIAGIISPAEAFAGFSNEGMLTVAALFVVAAAMRETGALDVVGGWLLGKITTERAVLFRMSVTVTTMSAFMNNTPIVAMLMPVLTRWCRTNRVSPSRVLIPLSYLTILGGVCTLIGTSTNIVVNGLMTNAAKTNPQLHPMHLFELTAVGVPCAIVGVVYLLTAGRKLLPERKDLLDQLGDSMREYLIDLRIQPECRLIGQRVQEAGLRHLPGLFLVEISRGNEVITPVAPEQLLETGDILTFTGVVNTIVDLERIPGLVPVADEGYESRANERRGRALSEAVISSRSPLVGKSIRDANFRTVYNAAVVAVHRGGERLEGRVGDIVLRTGDTLLLQTGPHFVQAHRNNPDFYLVSGVSDSRPARHDRMLLSIVWLAVLVVLLASGKIGTASAAFLIAALMVATRCISASDARESIDWKTLLTIAASFGIGKGMENSGLVTTISHAVVAHARELGPLGVLVILYMMTNITTELITHNAAAVLMFPFGVGMAGELGVDPRPYIIAITIAASCAFALPIGYQTNLMVYGPGGYRFQDFVKVGLPLDFLICITACTIIPFVWHFH